MINYLLSAMDEISDEHIEEAVNYKSKARIVTFKKVVAVAACLLVVFVSAFAVSEFTEPKIIPDVTVTTEAMDGDKTTANKDALTTATYHTVGGEATTDSALATTVHCQTMPSWDKMVYGQRFPVVNFDGKRYEYCSRQVEKALISKKLGEIEVTIEYLKDDFRSATAEIYDISDISSDLFIAVKFAENENEEYILYYNMYYEPETLGDFLSGINFSENANIIGDTVYYEQHNENGKVISFANYYVNESIEKKLWKLLFDKADTAFMGRYMDAIEFSSAICVDTEAYGQWVTINLTEEGYLYIYYSVDDDNFCFNIGKDVYNEFMTVLQSEAEIEVYDDNIDDEVIVTGTTSGPTTTAVPTIAPPNITTAPPDSNATTIPFLYFE